jgi:UV DNA damage endonuclease
MLRLGLCCTFRDEPVKFVTTTATYLQKQSPDAARAKLAGLCAANADSLLAALRYCHEKGIGDFRVNSGILPIKTHPTQGYELEDLPGGPAIIRRFKAAGAFVKKNGLRTGFHPDQFVVLNSPRPEVVQSSLEELEYQARVSEWIGADVINVHAGGAYGDKATALEQFRRNLARVSPRARKRLTVENDDKIFTPADLLPVCRSEELPLVYDVHHHRCNPDGMTEEEATTAALATWNREPLFHLSSPLEGWKGRDTRRHHDYIDIRDFPKFWRSLDITVEVEAKAKEVAVLRLARQLKRGTP